MAASSPVRVSLDELTEDQSGRDDQIDADGFEVDVGNLCASDPRPVSPHLLDPDGLPSIESAAGAAQALAAALFSLPGQADDHGNWIVTLPDPIAAIPREKPLPTARPETRWERFAKRKGIKKRKKEKRVWDEEVGEWRRRYGYKRVGDARDVAVLDAKPTDEVGEDPFTKMDEAKKERVRKQEKRMVANIKSAAKAGYVPNSVKLSAKLPEYGKGHPMDRKQHLSEVKSAADQAGVSTASMGKFDKPLPGETEGARSQPVKRRKPIASGQPTTIEVETLAKMADRLVRERSEDGLAVGRAIGHLEAAKREARHREKVERYMEGEEDEGGRGGKGGWKGKGGRKGKQGRKGGVGKVVAKAGKGAGKGRGGTRRRKGRR
ncbi:unnamed protein product [Ostreobium quekettii]|uniref:Ribosome biogenesis regulatory protein n=1 Tax=Ostreobium quekettii TaxID=121088 RepID=A0A8S1J2A6_9CHLO|nr:unnamed protein product [Ostreobium quekettii]